MKDIKANILPEDGNIPSILPDIAETPMDLPRDGFAKKEGQSAKKTKNVKPNTKSK